MKAVRIHKPEGLEGIEGLVYEDAPDPQPAIGDALVQVRAASFTPTELTWPLQTDRAGHDRGARIPAHEGSGVVVELGWGTAGVSVGDEVYHSARRSGQAATPSRGGLPAPGRTRGVHGQINPTHPGQDRADALTGH